MSTYPAQSVQQFMPEKEAEQSCVKQDESASPSLPFILAESGLKEDSEKALTLTLKMRIYLVILI